MNFALNHELLMFLRLTKRRLCYLEELVNLYPLSDLE